MSSGPELIGEIEQIPPRIAVAARELIDQLFDASCGFGQDSFFVADGERDLLAESGLQQKFEIGGNRGRPVAGARGIATLARLELVLLGRAPRPDAVGRS